MFDAPPLLWVTTATDYYAGDKPKLCHQARRYNLVWMTVQGKYTVCVLSGKVASILKYAKCLIHIDLCPVAIHRFEKSVNKKKDKLIKKNIVHNTVGDPMKDR